MYYILNLWLIFLLGNMLVMLGVFSSTRNAATAMIVWISALKYTWKLLEEVTNKKVKRQNLLRNLKSHSRTQS
jgi:sulfite exporter TauE/SafE